MAVKTLTASDEGDARGLALGRVQGEAFGRTLKHMLEDVADGGREIASGDYLIAYAVEKAEGMYAPKDGGFEWQAPTDENIHIEIAVRDRADGRLIPGLDVFVTVIDEDGKEVGTHRQPLLWHPYLYHYGRNWRVPGDGIYSLRVRFAAPQFHRHDKKNGNRLSKGADVMFEDVELKTRRE
jgi:Fe2+ transport protein